MTNLSISCQQKRLFSVNLLHTAESHTCKFPEVLCFLRLLLACLKAQQAFSFDQSCSVCTASQLLKCLSSFRDTRTAAEKRPADAAPHAQADERHYRDSTTDSGRDKYSKRYCSRCVKYPCHDEGLVRLVIRPCAQQQGNLHA